MYGQIARQVTRGSVTQEEEIVRLADYASNHIWNPATAIPYGGKQLEYLVKGIGWCDYQATVFVKLLTMRGIEARYAMLRNAHVKSQRPHLPSCFTSAIV